ncbi:DUF3037 domain-containing protein [Parapedobacter sp. 10938]|uniref:DUF3037 domain-containing protein n=1 Tax=Parapedobacter flavus TaxID=3110225 RepID=UPI002DBB1465|nr:DUF3037 domain-containing protein [Parapedobacter sp. 10938]MEC3880360.1 DUF3037 domain-containing protein [Parapedobacter sp. 10938]
MPAKELFEYAVIRVVPQVAREEFLNAGVVLYCRGQRFLAMRYTLDTSRLQAFRLPVTIDELESYLRAFQQVCGGHKEGGPIAALEMAERFRWLTAKRSTVIQTSAVHPGLCESAEATLDRLFQELVM